MKKKFNFIHLSLLLFVSTTLCAQINTDSIFNIAITQSKNQQFNVAIAKAKDALRSDSTRMDINVFIANVYSWKNNNDSAMIFINKVKKTEYKNDDFYESWSNILLRTKQYKALIDCCNEAKIHNYQNRTDLLRKKTIAYTELELYDEGKSELESVQNLDLLENEEIDKLYTRLLLKRNTKIISAYYTLDLFNNDIAAQNLGSLGYSFKIKQHTLAIRANVANRFGLNDLQLETDLYLQLKHKDYLYINYGYGFKKTLFPQNRIGLEYYFPLNTKTEASIGGRFLDFNSSNVYIATGHIGTYFGKSWLAFRPFYVIQSKVRSASFIGNYRLYGKNELYYWGLELGFGNSPDDIYSLTNSGFNELTTYKIKIEKNFMINRVSDIHIGLGYSYEEYLLNRYRNRITIEIGYKLRFL